MGYGDDNDDARGRALPSQTRTRLPDDDPDSAPRRPSTSPGRSLVTIVGVVVLLVAAIIFANQAGDDGGGSTGGATDGEQAQPTAPSGEQPVEGTENGIPAGFPQTEQGAESAAANYAVALGGEEMFNEERRHAIVDTIGASAADSDLRADFDNDYTPEFNAQIGLAEDGSAPAGSTFVSRTMPVGTSVESFDDTSAEVSVWCSGLFGMAGSDSTNPVRTSWFTLHFTLTWEGDDWKVVSTEQVEGPTPVNGDNRASTADDIAEAVEGYGGFTYAR